MKPFEAFQNCPRCGRPVSAPVGGKCFDCTVCGFRFYFNAATATAAFIRGPDGRWLFIRRQKEPGKGLLAPPGGFVDPGESAEAALRRELQEELGIEAGDLTFVCSEPNSYHYRGIDYPTVDLFFTTNLPPGQEPRALDGVEELLWLESSRVAPDKLAFPSMRQAWVKLKHSLMK